MESSQTIQQTTYDGGAALEVPDRGVDARPEDRPGVPMETTPHPAGGAHWTEPERQQPSVTVLKRMELDRLTPVFGTAQPPKGLSGVLRRVAYTTPEHRARHWMLLLLADRVDVMEHRLGRAAQWLPLAIPLIALGVGLARRRQQPWWRRVFA